jgi:hypothetical protein
LANGYNRKFARKDENVGLTTSAVNAPLFFYGSFRTEGGLFCPRKAVKTEFAAGRLTRV